MKNVIWCEVTCGCCGAVANSSGYYSPERIKKLKAETKDWVDDENYRVLCPACAAGISAERKYREAARGNNNAISAAVTSGNGEDIRSANNEWETVSVFNLFKDERE